MLFNFYNINIAVSIHVVAPFSSDPAGNFCGLF
uniref:Uncharacterized protein n=1 Tax=Arundo donax TaxID=35708 RepID=A0A0A9AYR1_ARUDO